MNEVFMTFLSLSLSGSLIFLILYLLKPFYKNYLTKTWQYYIFLIVILRLLIPFSPEISLINMLFNQRESYSYKENIVLTTDSSESNHVSESSPVDILPKQENNINILAYLKNGLQKASDLLWLGWIVPALILLLRKTISYHHLLSSIKLDCTKTDNANVINIYQKVCKTMKIKYIPELYQNENIATPMLVGAIHPIIVLPDLCLKDKELQYILQHELTHYKRLDVAYKWLVQIVVCLHWYNPLVYWIHREVNRNCELSCDEAIIKQLDETEKNIYGDMLLETIKLHKTSRSPVVSIMLNEDTKLIKERLISIMKFRKTSKLSRTISIALATFLFCGAVYTGAYSQSKNVLANSVSENSNIPTKEMPDILKYDSVPNFTKLQFGLYDLDILNTYSLTVTWKNDSDTLKLFLVGLDGYKQEYVLSNGTTENIKVPSNGLYYFESPRNRETGDIQELSVKFHVSNIVTSIPAKVSENLQTVVYENVEMRHYEQSSGSIPAHPYIHDIKTNNTNRKIIGHQWGMLAYDKEGKPLKIDWSFFDDSEEGSFYFLCDWGSMKMLPNETQDLFGGWSLNINGNDPAVNEIAYVLYCDKEITFEGGVVWKNPDFENWRKTYEGKTIDVNVLENYYPYVQEIAY